MPGFCFYKEFFMAIEDFVRDFNRHLDDAIGKAMEGDVANAVRTAIGSAVESEVYSERVYKRSEDHPYVRRDETGEPGGLQDRNVMEANYDPSTMTLEVQDRSQDRDSGRLIAPVVESGQGYQWKKSAIYKAKQARPFHQKAQEIAIGTGLVRDALAKSLTESGFKVKE